MRLGPADAPGGAGGGHAADAAERVSGGVLDLGAPVEVTQLQSAGGVSEDVAACVVAVGANSWAMFTRWPRQ